MYFMCFSVDCWRVTEGAEEIRYVALTSIY